MASANMKAPNDAMAMKQVNSTGLVVGFSFLDASSHRSMSVCPIVRPSVRL